MVSAQPIVRKKEGWLGVVLTALGCVLFLVWWFWPGDDDDSLQATPGNFLQAAQQARTPENSAALDAEMVVLGLQASALGEHWLAEKTGEAIEDSAMRDLVTTFNVLAETFDPVESPAVDAIDALLEEDKVDAALESAAALDSGGRMPAMLKIATFLIQSGRVDQARELIDQHLSQLPEDAVGLHLQLAGLHGQWGDFAGAEAAIKIAASGATTTADQLAVAKQCYSLNLFDEGLKLLERAEQGVNGDPVLAQEVIEVYLQVGETERARSLSERSAGSNSDDDSVALALELALAGWEEDAFAKALKQWQALKSVTGKSKAMPAIRDYFSAQLAAAEAPPLIKEPVTSGKPIPETQLSALQKAVDNGQPELAAEAIEEWQQATDRGRGYVILARLLLWRHARSTISMP